MSDSKTENKSKGVIEVEESNQMSLFSEMLLSDKKADYSKTVDIYDVIPKYVWAKKREHTDLENSVITRECSIRGKKLTVELSPAIIKKDDRAVLIYPGQREELIEDALRKIAIDGGGKHVNGKAGVEFTIYDLRKELKSMGHTYSFTEVTESLSVCSGAVIRCISENGESVINSTLFGLVALTTKEEDRKEKCYVQFNPLVNESIMNLTYRQYNYETGMSIRSPLARFIYKRMVQYWTQASPNNPYEPSLISMLKQTPRGTSSSMKDDIRAMRNALNELEKHDVISYYEEEKILAGKQKIIDIKCKVYPHDRFVSEVILSNQNQKAIKRASQA